MKSFFPWYELLDLILKDSVGCLVAFIDSLLSTSFYHNDINDIIAKENGNGKISELFKTSCRIPTAPKPVDFILIAAFLFK